VAVVAAHVAVVDVAGHCDAVVVVDVGASVVVRRVLRSSRLHHCAHRRNADVRLDFSIALGRRWIRQRVPERLSAPFCQWSSSASGAGTAAPCILPQKSLPAPPGVLWTIAAAQSKSCRTPATRSTPSLWFEMARGPDTPSTLCYHQ